MAESEIVPNAKEISGESLPCGKKECVFKAIDGMVCKMKEELAVRQHIQYPEQIVVAGIYGLTASTLAEACRRESSTNLKDCAEGLKHTEPKISLDTFIMLKQLRDEELISAECEDKIFNSLLKMDPSIRDQVEKDRQLGIL